MSYMVKFLYKYHCFNSLTVFLLSKEVKDFWIHK